MKIVQTIIIDNDESNEFILNYWTRSKEEQSKSKNIEEIVYSPISAAFAIQYKLFLLNFIFHPLIIKKKMFYEMTNYILDDNDLIENINKILEYELTSEIPFLSNEELKNLIAFHKLLNNTKS